MTTEAINPYLRTKVLTATPEELRLLLLDGCIRFLHQGREGLSERKFEQAYNGFSSAKAIILELINAMRPSVAPDLCARLEALYMYLYRRLTEGVFEKDMAKIDEVIARMDYERETWVMLMDRLAADRGGSPNAAAASATAAQTLRERAQQVPFADSAAGTARPGLSIRA